jgi:threonine/homoserine efflux transporter RhtA
MDWFRQQEPQVVRWVALAMFGLAFIFVYFANKTSVPVDIMFIVLTIAAGIIGFRLWLLYGEMVDRGPRR